MNEKSSLSKNIFFLNPNYYKKIGSFFLGMVNGRKDFLHSLGALGLSFVCLASPSYALDPNALPTGYQSAAGNVQFNQIGNTLNLSTQSQKSIVNYQTFNIGQNATVNMNLPSSQAAILNRVNGGFSSEIFGQLNSNGRVFLINPNGIIFGSSAQVNVGSLFASTLQMSDEDFLAGNYIFRQQGSSASIINKGKINASQGGAIALLGGAIENSGSLKAENGQVLLGVGKQISLNIDKNIGVDITVDQALEDKAQNLKNAITNTGSIQGNFIKAQAEFTNAIYDRAINNEGIIEAAGLVNNNGVIELISKTGIVENSGKVLANSELGNGGNIKIIGEETYLMSGSDIEANGKTGGGEILIGGDFQGKGSEHNSKITFIEKNTSISANALETGNGGKIIAWADETLIFDGKIEAKGGSESGNGGFIETSGKNNLAIGSNALVQTSALNGEFGTWLLDPMNITIQAGGSDIPTLAQLKDPFNSLDYTIDPTLLTGQASDVVLVATNNITNNSVLNFTNSGQDFTALAGNDIIFNSGSGVTTTNGSIILGASGNVQLNNANLTANNGDVILVSGVTLPLPFSSAPAGGTITGSGVLTGNSLLAASMTGGAVTLNNASNNFTNLTAYSPNGGNFNYTDANNINLTNYTVPAPIAAQLALFGLPVTYTNTNTNGALNISTVNGTINAGANITATNINLNAGGVGNITQTAGTISATNLSLTTQSGNATKSGAAGNANNTISTNITNLQANTNSGTIRISDVDGVNILTSNLNADGIAPLGSLTVRANGAGNITQTGTITGANNLSFRTASGSIDLGNFDNNTNSLNITSNSGNASFKDVSGFTLNSANLDANNNGTVGNLTLIAGGTGNISQTPTSGILKANELTVVSNTGNINLIGNNNDVNKIQITTNGQNGSSSTALGNATYVDINGFEVKGANLNADGTGTNGNLTLTAKGAGNITQTAGSTMQGQNLSLNTQSGSATITNADFSNLTANSTSGSITYSDADGININSSNLGTSNLTITSSATGLTADNGVAETDLTLSGNISAADVSLSTNNNNDAITQVFGTIEGNTLTLNTAGGAIEIGIAGKSDFAVLTGDLQTSDLTYTDTDGLLVQDLSGINANITTNKNTIAENLNGDPFGAEADLNLNNNILIDTLSLNALGNGQKISQLGGQATGNDLALSSNGGQIEIGKLGDADFTNIQGSTKGGNAVYIDTDGVNVQGFNVGNGDLQIVTAKDTTLTDLNAGGETDLNLAGDVNGQTVSQDQT